MLKKGDIIRATRSIPNQAIYDGDEYVVEKVQFLFNNSWSFTLSANGMNVSFYDYEFQLYFHTTGRNLYSMMEMLPNWAHDFDDPKCVCGAAALGHPGHSHWCEIKTA